MEPSTLSTRFIVDSVSRRRRALINPQLLAISSASGLRLGSKASTNPVADIVDLARDVAARFFTTGRSEQHANANPYSDTEEHPTHVAHRVTLAPAKSVANRTHSIPGSFIGILRPVA